MKKLKARRTFKMAFLMSVLLCAVFLISACNPGSTATETNPNTEASPFPDAQATAEPVNLGTFTIVIPDDGEYMLGTDNELVKQAIIKSIAEDRGVILDMNIIPLDYDDYFNQINAVLTTGQAIDGIVDKMSEFDYYTSIDNLCMPLDNLLLDKGTNLLNLIDASCWSQVAKNNSIYAVPGKSLPNNTAMYVRSDVLNMIGFPPIKTRENFETTLVALGTLIPSGIVPLVLNWEQTLDYMAYLHYIPSSDYWNVGKGYIMREQEEHYVDFLDMMKKFYTRGYIPEDFFDLTQDEIRTMFTSGLAMMYITEYTNVDDDYSALLSNVATAEVSLVEKPTFRRMTEPRYYNEGSVDDICVFTSYGQNQEALMVYLDWLISDVEHYETAQLGIMGTHINFNNYAHEYEFLGQYVNGTTYNAIYSLGLAENGIYSPVVPINGNTINIKSELLRLTSYEHLSTALIQTEPTFFLSAEAQSALYYYRAAMDDATRRYITSEITLVQFNQFLDDNKSNAKIITDELNSITATP